MKIQQSRADRAIHALISLALALIVLVTVYPIYFVIIASVSDSSAVANGQVWLYPRELYLEGYKRIFEYEDLWRGYRNTIFYAAGGTALSLLVTISGAYVMSRRECMLNRPLMVYFTIPMFFSGGLIPTYLLISSLGLLNNPLVLILPGCFGIYNMIIARTFFQSSIPGELRDAAFIDGCGECGFFVRIALPLSKAIISVIGLYVAVAIWNDYFSALIYITDREYIPLQLVLREILISNSFDTRSAGGGITNSALEQQRLRDLVKYCVMVVSTLPVICIYPFIQKYFEKGVMIGSIKG
ncbi:MAG TPA: carbohydrate ABC transporter permease [Candidatus Onthenecus intestinigallinarum]|uniref:Carbohydrate ABC transporter permease n=1 Tax=Candidatus Onthenecus intestinigallinarum TaxID=2840875 RepID=A0A9D0ZAW1_9FIRM|nr:carbohydrate ABC transporter permease [Candidatus Onthenecus intestinigallinarum]